MARAEKVVRIQTLWDILNDHEIEYSAEAQQKLQKASFDGAPVIHARWRIIETKIPVIACSNCWGEADVKHRLLYNYCPFCGARMDLRTR